MMRLSYFLILLPLFLFVSCQEDAHDYPVHFEFYLLNSDGKRTTDFHQGGDITFVFYAEPRVDEPVYLKNIISYQLPVVHQIESHQQVTVSDEQLIGPACQNPAHLELGHLPLPAYIFKFPWRQKGSSGGLWHCLDEPPTYLNKGKYRAEMKGVFHWKQAGETFVTDSIFFVVDFDVQ